MKLIVDGWYTDIYLHDDEVKNLCRPGKGKDTCSWLVIGANGWECCCLHKPHELLDRHQKKEMSALRNGCPEVKNINLMALGVGEHEVDVLNT